MTSYLRSVILMCVSAIVLQSMVAGINLAIPSLAAGALHPSHADLVWIVDSYVLTFAGLLIPAGALGDRIGRRRAVLAGLLLFSAACLVSGLAVNSGMLIAGRALGGVAAALVQPATLSICLAVAPAGRRAQTVATWTAAVAVGGIVGNLAAGGILDVASWRAFFLAFAPVAVVLVVLIAALVPEIPPHRARVAVTGTVLLVGALFALLYGIIEGPDRGWTSAPVLVAFLLAVLLSTGFVAHGLSSSAPLLDPRIFTRPAVRAGALGVGAGFFALFGLFFVNAQFLQDVKGYSTLRTGFAIGPVAVGMMIVAARGAALAARFGARRVVAVGLLAIAGGVLLLSTVTRTTPYPIYMVYLLVVATGLGISAPALTSAVLTGLPPEQAGLGSGVNSAAREVGAALGVAVIGTLLNSHDAWRSPAAFTSGMATGYRVLAGVLVALTVVVVASWRTRSAPVERLEVVNMS